MVANIRGYTPNYNFKLINFDTPRWHTLEYANWNQIDAMFLQLGVPGIRGEWKNGTLYKAGERVFDIETSDMYRCLIEHTSQPTGTFADERSILPNHWALQTLGVPLYRGQWVPGVYYSLGDLVYVNQYVYYVCVVTHTSSTVFSADHLFWQQVFDSTASVNDAAQSATDAEDSATSATASAASATASASSATASATSASSSATAASASATSANQAAAAATTQAQQAATSATQAADQASALRGTSTTSNTIAVGAKSFITQAGKQFNVGNFVTIVATANPNGQMMTGSITTYSGTALVVNVTGLLGTGTVADWQIYVSGMQGQKGTDGLGGGGIPEAPADGVLYGRVTNTWQAAVKRGGDIMGGHLGLPVGPAADQAVRRDYVDAAVVAIDLTPYAPKASPALTGNPTAPTPTAGDNDTSIATTAFVTGAIGALPAPPVAATSAEYLVGTNATKFLTPQAVWNAAAYATITDAATVIPDFSLGIDFLWTIGGLGRTMANPLNAKNGQKGVIYIIQDATGGRTISGWGNKWLFPGAVKPVLTTAANSVDIISYVVASGGVLYCNFTAAYA